MYRFFKKIIFLCAYFYAVIALADRPCQIKEMQQIESYLNNFKKVALPFTQASNRLDKENSSSGIMLIEKPLKFRVNYDTPHPLVIVGGKNFVSIYDYELQELSRVAATDNLFKFLLELNVSLQESVKIEKCTLMQGNIELLVRHEKTQQYAKINFAENPVVLKEMDIPDSGDDTTKNGVKIIFDKPIFAKSFDQSLFMLRDVKIYGAPKRYSSAEILKLVEYDANF